MTDRAISDAGFARQRSQANGDRRHAREQSDKNVSKVQHCPRRYMSVERFRIRTSRIAQRVTAHASSSTIARERQPAISHFKNRTEENDLKHHIHALAFAAFVAMGADAGATVITFDNLAVGSTLSTQYAGVVFSPNALVGGTYAHNTDMTIVSATGSDVGFDLGTPNLVSGNVLRSFSAYLNEDGDPSFKVSFQTAISSFSATFAGVFDSSDVSLFAYDGATLLSSVVGTSADAQFILALAGRHITSVIVTPGTFNDYVVVDNVQFTAVPEPETWLLLAFGLGVFAWSRRRLQQSSGNAARFGGSSALAAG